MCKLNLCQLCISLKIYRYQEGMLKSKIGDASTSKLIEGATAGMVATVDKEGLDAVNDWEVDELLDWTNGLNFDE